MTSCELASKDNQNTNPALESKNMADNTIEDIQKMNEAPILFYNVENLFDTEDDPNNDGDDEFLPHGEKIWDAERYQDKLNKIAEAMLMANGETPLFAGFAEIENHEVLEDLAMVKTLKNVNYKIVQYDSPDNRGIDVGCIYDPAKFKLITSEKLPISIAQEPEYKMRDILYVQGRVEENIAIHIFVNHWSSRREGQDETAHRRIACAQVLKEKINKIRQKDPRANIIVMGDFNDTPLDTSIKSTLGAKSRRDNLKSHDLVNLMYELEIEDRGTINFRGDWMTFDQMMVSFPLYEGSSGLKIIDRKATIVNNAALLYHFENGDSKPNATFGGNQYYGGYSDHLPVYMVLKPAR